MRTLYRNGRIHTDAVAGATALLVDGADITWLGREDAVAAVTADRVADLAHGHLLPAFVDAHLHATSTGQALAGPDLAAAGSLAEVLDLVERAARTGRGRPVIAGGWDETGWPERRPPTCTELDRAGYGGAVYLSRVDKHSAVVSSTLAAAVPGLADLPGYRPDGWLTLAAHDAARAATLAALTPGQTRDLQRLALRHAASMGIACVHEMAGPVISSAADLAGVLAMAAEEPLPQVIGYWGELLGIDTARELGAAGAAGDLFCDGSLGSHTAALFEPYADRPDTRGTLRFDTADVADHVARCAEAGLQAGFHAIGDAAVDQVVDAVERAGQRLGRPVGGGHRIEHAEYVRNPHRLAASGLIASMQPVFDATWGGPERMYADRLGPERASRLNRFAELEAAGVPLAFGSDAPVTALGPWAAIRAAVHPSDPAAGLDAGAAFAAHTAGGWRAARCLDSGQLTVGAPATFAVWTGGDWTASGLPDVSPGTDLPTCVRTVLRGEAIFTAGG